MYTTTAGKINICDFREGSDFHKRPSMVLDSAQKAAGGKASVFNKWTNCVSDARFIEGSTQVVSRDFLNVKLWDLRAASNQGSSSKSVYSAQVTDYMERNLTTLMDQDMLDDQFFVDITPDGKHMATGGYNKSGHVIDINSTSNTVIPCNFGANRDSQAGKLKVYSKAKRLVQSQTSSSEQKLDLKKSVNLGCWAPNKTNKNK